MTSGIYQPTAGGSRGAQAGASGAYAAEKECAARQTQPTQGTAATQAVTQRTPERAPSARKKKKPDILADDCAG